MMSTVLQALGQPDCADGLAALRFWGQTGDRPDAWMAAADPVHLAAELDRLRLHRLAPDEWSGTEFRQLFDELQGVLGEGDDLGFVRIGEFGYLCVAEPIKTARFSTEVLHGRDPADMLPGGTSAAAYHNLLSEIQMTMHSSVVNQQRIGRNQRTVNSLWIWGGGIASVPEARKLPTLFADDPLLRGFWYSGLCDVESWPGGLEKCVDKTPNGFVAIAPEENVAIDEYSDTLTRYLQELRQILKNGGARKLTLLFRDGLTATIRRHHTLRFWRRGTRLPDWDESNE